MKRRLGLIIAFDDLASPAILFNEFDRRDKEIEEVIPWAFVELVEEVNQFGLIVAEVAEILADMGPIFPFAPGHYHFYGRAWLW